MKFELNSEIVRIVESRRATNSLSQAPFDWSARKSKWIETFPNFEDFLCKLANPLGRSELRALATDKNISDEEFFLAVMVWGFGTTGYGAYRVQNMTRSSLFKESLAEALKLSRKGKPLDAYSFLAKHKIKGLGPAFGTKLISFATPRDIAAPIFDSFVAKWINEFEPHAFNGVSIRPSSWNVKTYSRYLEWVSFHASSLKCLANEIELAIFQEGLSKFSTNSPWNL